MQPQVLQGRGREAGRVALRAQHDPLDVVVYGLREPGVARRVTAPFEHVAFDYQRARYSTFAVALSLRADVDQHGSASESVSHLLWLHPPQPAPGGLEDVVDSACHYCPSG
jgi:hypothetical protein